MSRPKITIKGTDWKQIGIVLRFLPEKIADFIGEAGIAGKVKEISIFGDLDMPIISIKYTNGCYTSYSTGGFTSYSILSETVSVEQ